MNIDSIIIFLGGLELIVYLIYKGIRYKKNREKIKQSRK
ncbi:hypothetical protein BHECKSOX_1079 [Bathymodiolus heckerae thiotrophic gill symbiont]|nr:hypothetical protein BHECKSOX_1079 [Bathymodiolus heckerae thiotrophic gill symbiont]